MKKILNSNDGMSLMAVLMVVAITGVVIMAISQMLVNNRRESMVLENQIDKIALNRYLMSAASCPLTQAAAPNPCPDGTYVAVSPLKGANPLVVKFSTTTPNNATKIGKWTVRAKCGPSKTLIFEAKLTNSNDSNNTFKNISPDVPFGCVMP